MLLNQPACQQPARGLNRGLVDLLELRIVKNILKSCLSGKFRYIFLCYNRKKIPAESEQ